MLLIPDLLGYWLTGEHVTERTNASTTGLLDVTHAGVGHRAVIRLGLDPTLFPTSSTPATSSATCCPTSPSGSAGVVPVVAVGSHDTASAVVGVPMQTDDAAYISFGTWGLVGVELDKPVLTEEAGPRTSPTRAASTARSGSSPTSWAPGC